MASKSKDYPSGKTGACGPAFCYTRNAEGLREPERKKGCLTPVELDYSRRYCKRSKYERIIRYVDLFFSRKSNVRGSSFVS